MFAITDATDHCGATTSFERGRCKEETIALSTASLLQILLSLLFISRSPFLFRGEKFLERRHNPQAKSKIRFRFHDDALEMELAEETLPWMVPACSQSMLQRKVAQAGADLFGTADVAGLVPDEATNGAGRMDSALLYRWKDASDKASWKFEFRARSASYSLVEGVHDLETKCKAGNDRNERKPFNRPALLIRVN